MTLPKIKRNTPEDQSLKDQQEQYDESLLEYTDGKALEASDEAVHQFKGRFPRDFYKYSQNFRDNEDGPPGNDQDFGTERNQLQESYTVSGAAADRRIREEVVDALARDFLDEVDDVTVRVEGGVVSLTGTVSDSRTRLEVEDSVQSVPGVDEVIDYLLVEPPDFSLN